MNRQKTATEALKIFPASPRLPSGVPAGHDEAGAAAGAEGIFLRACAAVFAESRMKSM